MPNDLWCKRWNFIGGCTDIRNVCFYTSLTHTDSLSALWTHTILLPLFSPQDLTADSKTCRTVVWQRACFTCSTCSTWSTWTYCVWPNKAGSQQHGGHSFHQCSIDPVCVCLSLLMRRFKFMVTPSSGSHTVVSKELLSFFLEVTIWFKFLCPLRARSEL